jgi:hypothetical protein
LIKMESTGPGKFLSDVDYFCISVRIIALALTTVRGLADIFSQPTTGRIITGSAKPRPV